MSLVLSPSHHLPPSLPSLPETGMNIDLNASPDKNVAKLILSLQLRKP